MKYVDLILNLLISINFYEICQFNTKMCCIILICGFNIKSVAVADPGFPMGGTNLIGGCQLLRWLCFEKIVCQNKRIWTLRGHTPAAPPGSANVWV